MSHLRVVPGGAPRVAGPKAGSAASVRVEAPGKVNLFLSCGAPGADGYHPLTTVFQAVRLIETVTARRQAADARGAVTLSLAEPDDAVPTDGRNLAVRAARLLAEETGVEEGVDLLVRKRVPVAGGMAGGSADAAATLLACNHLWGTGLGLGALTELASRLGADCAFPLIGSAAVGHGRGDRLSPLMTRGTYHWVFAVARQGLSTPEVFARLDQMRSQHEAAEPVSTQEAEAVGHGTKEGGRTAPAPVPEELTAALRSGDARALAATMHNDLQAAALDLRPELAEVIEVAQDAGALRAIVSGSGPTVAALVEDTGTAMRVSRALTACGLVAGTVRADAPVAGARVVG
ncbi:4-(cytidine 5'-diphospho)-2-C-methyl-D-erythritol kinase [Actinomyces faecalis]|uniref:4-(cytidine 5'-diphospho)-2-C-methyl-D-erythritol kinase n=1 Tax=Actinomyces faecalis TaxID=2722820 RepID=UPI00155524D2|nr:4-(cytidine 5'-diphospho)-2-C-methyl-D-erythritol kinase [Actinomyces faecalis]